MKALLILSLIAALGVGGTYLVQEPTRPVVIQEEEGVTLLEKARRATCLIALPDYRVSGSATLVGRKKLDNGKYRYTALTAYHVVEDMAKKFAEDKTTASHTIKMMFQPNFHGKAFRITIDIDDINWALPSHDWATIVFDMESKISCAEVATEEEFKAITPFEKIYAVSYGDAYGQFCRDGIIGATHNEHLDAKGQAISKWPWNIHPEKFFRPYINSWFGDSGGAIYNQEGKLIGIINAFNMINRGWDNIPVTHSTVAYKAHIVRDIVKYSKDFFLVED